MNWKQYKKQIRVLSPKEIDYIVNDIKLPDVSHAKNQTIGKEIQKPIKNIKIN